jgi:hypothetical protein
MPPKFANFVKCPRVIALVITYGAAMGPVFVPARNRNLNSSLAHFAHKIRTCHQMANANLLRRDFEHSRKSRKSI